MGRRVLKRDMEARRTWLQAAMARTLTPEERQALGEASALMLRVVGEEPIG